MHATTDMVAFPRDYRYAMLWSIAKIGNLLEIIYQVSQLPRFIFDGPEIILNNPTYQNIIIATKVKHDLSQCKAMTVFSSAKLKQ